MEGQLTEAVKAARSDRMLELHERRAKEYENFMLGKRLEILLEEEIILNGHTYLVGHSREYIRTAVEKQEGLSVNDIISVRAEKMLEDHLILGVL